MTDDELYEEIQNDKQFSASSAPSEEPNAVKPLSFLAQLTTIGTRPCAWFCAVLGIIIAVLLLALGLWKTLFIVLFGVVGAFIGGVPQKNEWLKKMINKTFPPKH